MTVAVGLRLVIWKYPLKEAVSQLDLPRGARLLCVQVQENVPTLWALVNPEAPIERRIIASIGTGKTIIESTEAPLAYISTVQMSNGLVWHFWEVLA